MTELCNQNVVDVATIQAVREGLIRLGYANESVSDNTIQDCYVSYVMIRQTAIFEHIEAPYALALLSQAVQNRMLSGGDMFADNINKSLSLGVVSMPETQCEIVVPASLLTPIKQSLIALGYASNGTPLQAVQDCYFRYVIVRQIGYNPEVPFATCFIPQELRDALNPGVPEPTEEGLYLASGLEHQGAHALIESGNLLPNWALASSMLAGSKVSYQRVSANSLSYAVPDTSEYSYNPETNIIRLSKNVLLLFKVKGMTDELLAQIESGDMSAQIGIKLPEMENWQWQPYSVVKDFAPIFKMESDFYIPLLTSDLTPEGIPRNFGIGFDFDGIVNDDATVLYPTYTITIGTYLRDFVPPAGNVVLTLLDSLDLNVMHNSLASGSLSVPSINAANLFPVAMVNMNNLGFNGASTQILVDYGKEFKDNENSSTGYIHFTKQFVITCKLAGLTTSMYNDLIAGQGNVELYLQETNPDTGNLDWVKVPAEIIADMLLGVNNGSGGINYYAFTTLTQVDPNTLIPQIGVKNGASEIVGIGNIIAVGGDAIYPAQFESTFLFNAQYLTSQGIDLPVPLQSEGSVLRTFSNASISVQHDVEGTPETVQGAVACFEYHPAYKFAFSLRDLNAELQPDSDLTYHVNVSNRVGSPTSPYRTYPIDGLGFKVQYTKLSNSWKLIDWDNQEFYIPRDSVIQVGSNLANTEEIILSVLAPIPGGYVGSIKRTATITGIFSVESPTTIDVILTYGNSVDTNLSTFTYHPVTNEYVPNGWVSVFAPDQTYSPTPTSVLFDGAVWSTPNYTGKVGAVARRYADTIDSSVILDLAKSKFWGSTKLKLEIKPVRFDMPLEPQLKDTPALFKIVNAQGNGDFGTENEVQFSKETLHWTSGTFNALDRIVLSRINTYDYQLQYRSSGAWGSAVASINLDFDYADNADAYDGYGVVVEFLDDATGTTKTLTFPLVNQDIINNGGWALTNAILNNGDLLYTGGTYEEEGTGQTFNGLFASRNFAVGETATVGFTIDSTKIESVNFCADGGSKVGEVAEDSAVIKQHYGINTLRMSVNRDWNNYYSVPMADGEKYNAVIKRVSTDTLILDLFTSEGVPVLSRTVTSSGSELSRVWLSVHLVSAVDPFATTLVVENNI